MIRCLFSNFLAVSYGLEFRIFQELSVLNNEEDKLLIFSFFLG